MGLPKAPGPRGEDERNGFLEEWDRWTERPLAVLGFVWLGLLVWELLFGLTGTLDALVTAIWVLFLVDFLLRLALAPRKGVYLRRNWLLAVSLAIPAFRVFRAAAVVRVLARTGAAPGARVLRILTSINRGMIAVRESFGRRGFGYVLALTAVVLVAGAAGMYSFERGGVFDDFGTALWWTAMIMTTLGSERWPRTGAGRILCVFLSVYAIAVFSYITAAVASYFVGRDRDGSGGTAEAAALRKEVDRLRRELEARETGERP